MTDVRQDAAQLRSSDVPVLHGDASKFRRVTDWVPFEATLYDRLKWRAQ